MKPATRDKLGTVAGVVLLLLFILGALWYMSRPAPAESAAAVTLPADTAAVDTATAPAPKPRKPKAVSNPARDIHNIPIPTHDPSQKN